MHIQLLLLMLIVGALSVVIVQMFWGLRADVQPKEAQLISGEDYYKDPFNRRLLVILTSQASGSQRIVHIFNNDQSVFQVIEPLDSVFVTLYGTQMGWNSPADIYNHQNGSARSVTSQELYSMSEIANSLLTCNMEVLPSENLFHRFWWQFQNEQSASAEYIGCAGDPSILTNCLTPLANLCGQRFVDSETSRNCLWNLFLTFRADDATRAQNPLPVTEKVVLDEYANCLTKARKNLIDLKCISKLEHSCLASKTVVLKVARGGMDFARQLLSMNPNVKFVYFLRNPLTSVGEILKTEDSSMKGVFSNGNASSEALVHCRRMATELKAMKILQESHPHSFLQVTYEKLLTDPAEQTRRLYDFLHLDIPSITRVWLSDPKLSVSPQKWDAFFSLEDAKTVMEQCKEVIDLADVTEWHS
ncbi:hypothetical protein CAPTEDRAFT_186561 [Capitella teleta]|uniref:Sulfotransferase domain-containing protein n=1 Tax=Capitella teleta TaxID=283909 RepID=R7U0S9_CAPTE|nr:hypothetical protein CAPTEDRAFT_186561 [Capitella teleta]|eukprot:ELT99614.1 hypothetical protein CAPTEDRAFT_186561 [Capitella teleta]